MKTTLRKNLDGSSVLFISQSGFVTHSKYKTILQCLKLVTEKQERLLTILLFRYCNSNVSPSFFFTLILLRKINPLFQKVITKT